MQQDLAPISGSAEAAVPTAQLHHISFNSPPYYSPSLNPNLNSSYNYNYLQSYSSNGVNSLIQSPSIHPISDLNVNPYGIAASNQQYAKIPLRNTNQITDSQKHRQWKNRPPRKKKAVQSYRCEVCKVDCNSESVRDLHYLGNKHKKNLQKLDVANSGNPFGWCEVCKVEFTSKIVLDQHYLGKRHMKNLEKLDVANSNVPLAWCEVCQTNYNSKIVLDHHKLGKKHKKNSEKLIAVNSSALSTPTLQPVPESVPAIGSGENPSEATTTPEQRQQKKEGALPEPVCMCSVCNVVCNSLVVFKYHLAGKKHSAMMKKHVSAISCATDK